MDTRLLGISEVNTVGGGRGRENMEWRSHLCPALRMREGSFPVHSPGETFACAMEPLILAKCSSDLQLLRVLRTPCKELSRCGQWKVTVTDVLPTHPKTCTHIHGASCSLPGSPGNISGETASHQEARQVCPFNYLSA